MKFYERVISDFGGYEKCKDILSQPNIDFIMNAQGLREHMLEYRRQYNIFEIDDYVVYQGDAGLSGLFRIEKLTKTGKPKSVKSNRFGGFPCRYCEVRHATDAEIKVGKRLEVNQ